MGEMFGAKKIKCMLDSKIFVIFNSENHKYLPARSSASSDFSMFFLFLSVWFLFLFTPIEILIYKSSSFSMPS